MLETATQQALDVCAATSLEPEGGKHPTRVRDDLARLVVAEHDRLCGSHLLALYCEARASCRAAAEVLRS